MLLELFFLAILVLLSATFSGIEIAYFSLSAIKTRHLVEKKVKNAKRVQKLKSNPEKLLITILIGNNIINIGAASYATLLATEFFGNSGAGIAIGAMTFLILVFGEITPKAIANAKNEKICLLTAKPLSALMYLLYPLIYLLELITKLITKILGARKSPLISEEELKIMAKLGVEERTIEKHEGEIINKVFEMNDITALDVMTVKTEMFILDGDEKIYDKLPEIVNLPYSRIPVYINEKDNIVGVLYVRDILKKLSELFINKDSAADFEIKIIEIAKKPIYIPGQMLINDLLKQFQKKHIQIALVVDEVGDIQGLVTLEDVLEELVGEIIDETDVEKESIKRLDKKNILVDGMTEIEDINDFFNIKINAPRKEFLSKILLDNFGKIPKTGDEIIIDDHTFFITDADEKKINKIKITKK